MSKNLTKQLIKLGNSNPSLRPHLTPILDSLQGRMVNAHRNFDAFFTNLLRQDLSMDEMTRLTKSFIYSLSFDFPFPVNFTDVKLMESSYEEKVQVAIYYDFTANTTREIMALFEGLEDEITRLLGREWKEGNIGNFFYKWYRVA